MNKFAKVTDHKELIRDMHSKAVLNIDTEALLEHRKRKSVMQEIVNNSTKINKLENDIQEIKEMLFSILKNRN